MDSLERLVQTVVHVHSSRLSRRGLLKLGLAGGLSAGLPLLASCRSAEVSSPTAPVATTPVPITTSVTVATPTAAASPQMTTPKSGGTLIVATTVEAPSLEPHLEAADAWTRRTVLLYENLVWMDNELKPQPQLAEAWEQTDDSTFVFQTPPRSYVPQRQRA